LRLGESGCRNFVTNVGGVTLEPSIIKMHAASRGQLHAGQVVLPAVAVGALTGRAKARRAAETIARRDRSAGTTPWHRARLPGEW
jgi:hypothetical protein